MNKEENNFEEFLRSNLENHTVEVSDSVWAGIEKKQKNRDIFVWFRHYLNVFVALDVIFVLGLTVFTTLNSYEVQSQNQLNETIAFNENKIADNKSNKEIIKHTIINAYRTEEKIETKIAENTNIKVEKAQRNRKKINEPIVGEISSFNKQLKQGSSAVIKENTKQNKEKKTSQISTTQLTLQAQENNNKSEPILYAFTNLPSLKYQAISNAKNNSNFINERSENIEVLSASIELSKPKKVLKEEQKKAMKVQKEIAKITAQIESKNKSNQENKATESLNNVIPETESLANNNEDAPLTFDTVYGKKKFKGYIAIDALISPDIAFSNLKGSSEIAQNFIARRDSAERLRIAYSALMRVNLFINKNIFIHSGISFSQRKEKFSIEHKWQTHEDYIDSSKYVTIVDPFVGNVIYKTYDTLDYVSTYKETLEHNLVMSFLDVPIMVGYKWIGKRSGIALQAGAICNLLFKQKGIIADYNYTANDVTKENQNPFNTSAGLSIAGAISSNFKLSDKLDLLIEPHTRYVLKPISSNAYPIQQKIFTYGLNVGLRLKL